MLSELNQTPKGKCLFSSICRLLSEIGMKIEHEVGMPCGEKKVGERIMRKKCELSHVFSHMQYIDLNLYICVISMQKGDHGEEQKG